MPLTIPISKSANRIGNKNGRWKGGQITDGRGRIAIYSPNHPNPSLSGLYVYRYRLVVEKSIGRYLTSDEVVHHINGIPTDDRIENLMVMTNSEHMKLHQNQNKHQQKGIN